MIDSFRVKRLCRAISLFVRVKSSGLFNSKIYKRQRPDIGRFPPVLHWALYGQREAQKLGFEPFSEWLLPPLVKGDIRLKNIKALRRLVVHDEAAAFDDAAQKMGLNANDYRYLKFYYQGDFTKASRVLKDTSPDVFFNGAFDFASRHMKIDWLERAYNMSSDMNNCMIHLRKRTDIIRTLGRDSLEDVQVLMNALKYSLDPVLDQIYRARLPFVSQENLDSCIYADALSSKGLSAVKATDRGQGGDFARSVSGFESLITAATYNEIFESKVCIKGMSPERAKIIPLSDAGGVKIRVRILMPNYWVFPQNENVVTGDVLSLQKAFIRDLLAQGHAVVPIFATPIFDITAEDNYGLTTLSYHTVITAPKSERYIHFKESYLPDYFTYDATGYSGWSSLSKMDISSSLEEVDVVRRFHEDIFQTYCVNRLSKYSQTDEVDDGLPSEPFIFVALQVPDDTVSFWSHMPRDVWLDAVCRFGETNNVPIVIKVHPKDKSQASIHMIEAFKGRKNVYVSRANIHDLIDRSLAVVTTNSGVGFEALLYHKPVINCGLSDYAAVTYTVKTCEGLTEALGRVYSAKHPATKTQINQFLYSYLNDHCWNKAAIANHASIFDFTV